MGEVQGSIAGPINDGVYLEIDPTWLDHHKDYPLNFDTTVKLPFIFIDLEDGIEESAEANYTDFEVIGRAESYKSYIGTGNREFPLVFKFRAQGLGDFGGVESALLNEVRKPALWLDSLQVPWVGRDGLSHAPPPCILSLGQLFFGRVVVAPVQISWQPPFDPDTFLPHGADVTCTCTVVREHIENYSFGAVR